MDWGDVVSMVLSLAALTISGLSYRQSARKETSDQEASRAAVLTARYDGGAKGSGHVIVTNSGPAVAELTSVTAPNAPNLLVGSNLESLSVQLHKGEDFSIMAAPHLGISWPVMVRLNWNDPRGPQSRDHPINL